MVPDLPAAMAADRHRLATAIAPRAALRLRWGRRLVSLGLRVSGDSNGLGNRTHPMVRKEVDGGTRSDVGSSRAVRSLGG